MEELLKYLEFEDVDFKDPKSMKDFEEINFPTKSFEETSSDQDDEEGEEVVGEGIIDGGF